MDNPTLTAAVPVYNGARYIGATIDSLLNQSQPAEDILVIDDGSTDNTVEICRKHPVRLIEHKDNQGLATARNTAIENTETDIILYIDVDAPAHEDLVRIISDAYNKPGIGGVGGQGIESNIHTLADRWRRAHAQQGHGDKSKEVDHLFGLCMSYSLEVLREVGGFNPEFRTNGEDMDMGLRVTNAGYRLLYLPEAIVYHQRSDDNQSLLKTMANWYTAGYRAKKINQAQPWKLYLGVLRHSITDSAHDLFVERDLGMIQLSFQVNWMKLRALWKARFN